MSEFEQEIRNKSTIELVKMSTEEKQFYNAEALKIIDDEIGRRGIYIANKSEAAEVMPVVEDELVHGIKESDLTLFVGKKSEFYLKKWKSAKDINKLAGWSWNWSSFCLGLFWFGYRKMYTYLFLFLGMFLFLDIIELATNNSKFSTGFTIFFPFLCGLLGNLNCFFYAKNKIEKIKALNMDSVNQNRLIQEAGGTSWGGVGISCLLIIAYIAINYMLFEMPTTGLPKTSSKSNSITSETVKKNKLEVLNSDIKTGKYGERNVIGTIKNNTDKQYGYVEVEINLYDNSGSQVGGTFANTQNLEPNGIWTFKAPIIYEDARSYKIKKISAD